VLAPLAWLLCLVLTAGTARAASTGPRGGTIVGGTGFEATAAWREAASPPAAEAEPSAFALDARPRLPDVTLGAKEETGGEAHIMFGAERAQVLLRSLTIPGWGQATAGRTTSATLFVIAEAAIWGSFTAFRIQESMRNSSYERTAKILAGINLDGRDEEFRRIVGFYLSSDEYNLYVVYRDAANLYYDDPVAYRQYIAEHELKGEDTWQWQTVGDILRYRGERKDAQRARMNANTALACAVVNRLISALHAARFAGQPHGQESQPRSWNIEAGPSNPQDPTAYRIGLSARF
jgi:hypothetical protein